MPGGYSGRSLDSREVTPFLKMNNFVSMSESGWLTRSLEQNRPYNKDYPGQITPGDLKQSFLQFLDKLERSSISPKAAIFQIFKGLIEIRDRASCQVARPQNLSIDDAVRYLDLHFQQKYESAGASRLPVLAIYSLLKCICAEFPKYSGKRLGALGSHTSADSQSGSVGDIEIFNLDNSVFEAYEIKHNICIDAAIFNTARNKAIKSTATRYYILSTREEASDLSSEIESVRSSHGCVFVIDGVLATIRYSLRYVTDLNQFVSNYAECLENDEAIRYEHKAFWDEVIESRGNLSQASTS